MNKTSETELFIPVAQWGKDHWATLAYMETVMVEMGFFQVGADPRMRSNRRHFRVMAEGCPKPARASHGRPGVVMLAEHGTRLKGGGFVSDHDDWMCVQDMAHAGLLSVSADRIQPGAKIKLSDLGVKLMNQLRAFKAGGGMFAKFEPAAE